jgi:hypothetical protein
MYGDLAYLRGLLGDDPRRTRVAIIEPSVAAFAAALGSDATDYVGTRLHGGIFALQHGVRSLIVAVDNRAAEISRDTGLHVITRDDIEGLRRWIAESPPIALRMPQDGITQWKSQFVGRSSDER